MRTAWAGLGLLLLVTMRVPAHGTPDRLPAGIPPAQRTATDQSTQSTQSPTRMAISNAPATDHGGAL